MKKRGRPKGTKSKWNRALPFEGRFWEKVDKKSDDECWEWQAFVRSNGYGMFSVNRKMVSAHRVSWILSYGEIPDGLYALHKCDNRKCVNPKHLFLGTYQDNAIDRDNKKRGKIPDNRGEKHGMSKLTEKDVREIRFLYAGGYYTQQSLADKFGVIRQTISKIVSRNAWVWLK